MGSNSRVYCDGHDRAVRETGGCRGNKTRRDETRRRDSEWGCKLTGVKFARKYRAAQANISENESGTSRAKTREEDRRKGKNYYG